MEVGEQLLFFASTPVLYINASKGKYFYLHSGDNVSCVCELFNKAFYKYLGYLYRREEK